VATKNQNYLEEIFLIHIMLKGVTMKKIEFLPFFMLFVFVACSTQEAENHSRFYVQI